MKSITYNKFGDPAQVLTFSDSPVPTPKAGEVLIKMLLSPIHNHDLWTARGNYGYKPELPATGGTEALGIVEAVGEGVDAALIGKRVVKAGALATWAEYFTTAAAGVLPLPDAISDEAGAQLIAMPFSALSLLEFLNVKQGDWVVQTAANGAVGKIFYELAKQRGIHTINLVRRKEAADELIAGGMENVFSTSDSNWLERAKEIVGADGARAAIDSVGGKVVAEIVNLLGKDGVLAVFGTATGEPLQLSAGEMISKHLNVKGFWGSRVSSEMPDADKARLIGELIHLAVEGKLPLTSGGTFALADIKQAVDASLTPGRTGKIMLRP
ncbi:MAG: zinc-binding dehydrogenase [Rhodobacteraceae bacterium]|nr:zinc-binding dehydrogenase [Paracoccaceae bacterium]